MNTFTLVLLDVQLMVFLSHPGPGRPTKIIDYDNVVENPYYRKSNLELLIRKQCNFLQVKTTTLAPPPTVKDVWAPGDNMANRLKEAFEQLGYPINSKNDLSNKVVDGLVNFIRAVNPNHELSRRNLTDEERNTFRLMLPKMIEKIDKEEYDDLDGDDDIL